jgi:hypothetical protein
MLLCAAAGRAQSGAPDKFIEAATYANFASSALKCEDRASKGDAVGQATKWTKKAVAAMEGFQTADPDEQARAARFLSRQKTLLLTLGRWDKFLREGQKKVQSALNGGRLETAAKMVAPENGPQCDPRMRGMRTLVEARRKLYAQALAEADRLVESDPLRAVEKYKAAAKLNREDPALQEKIRRFPRK